MEMEQPLYHSWETKVASIMSRLLPILLLYLASALAGWAMKLVAAAMLYAIPSQLTMHTLVPVSYTHLTLPTTPYV